MTGKHPLAAARLEETRMRLTSGYPALSPEYAMNSMRWFDLLTQEADAGISQHSRVQGILALPRAQGRMGTIRM